MIHADTLAADPKHGAIRLDHHEFIDIGMFPSTGCPDIKKTELITAVVPAAGSVASVRL
ncbi:hypothetical protein AB0A95_30315 [Micromonospora sp. NPDC049230]|uniref:hypothetical protein n=1 Tax=Micromonospora sp. NPDC049230 TaxID=3155502 RepID=UPI0033E97B20